MNQPDDLVVLEGGGRDGQAVPFAQMRREAIGKFVLEDPCGVYRHDEERISDFRNGQRVAVFEPADPDEAI